MGIMQVGFSCAALFFLAVNEFQFQLAEWLSKAIYTARKKEEETWFGRENNNVGVIRDIWAV